MAFRLVSDSENEPVLTVELDAYDGENVDIIVDNTWVVGSFFVDRNGKNPVNKFKVNKDDLKGANVILTNKD